MQGTYCWVVRAEADPLYLIPEVKRGSTSLRPGKYLSSNKLHVLHAGPYQVDDVVRWVRSSCSIEEGIQVFPCQLSDMGNPLLLEQLGALRQHMIEQSCNHSVQHQALLAWGGCNSKQAAVCGLSVRERSKSQQKG